MEDELCLKTYCTALSTSLALLLQVTVQIIMQAATAERTADCTKVREDIARLIYLYLGKHDFAFHCYEEKAPHDCMLRGSLAYLFSRVLLWMQYETRSSHRNFLYNAGN